MAGADEPEEVDEAHHEDEDRDLAQRGSRLRFRSRDSSRKNGRKKWTRPAGASATHCQPWLMRCEVPGDLLRQVADQMIRNCEN